MGKKSAIKSKQEKRIELKVVPATKDVVREGLLQTVISLGLEEIVEIVEEERTKLCGPKHSRDPERGATRYGTAPSELVLGGRRVSMRRPRVRTRRGEEQLSSWQHFADEDPLDERAMEQMLVGVSTRKYDRSLESVGDEVKTRGTSRSAVSRRFVAGTKKRLEELQGRDLSTLAFAVLMIDGIHIGEHVVLVALGIDDDGYKHVLGLQEGATENSASCRALMSNLTERGLRADRTVLAVLDGSKALRRAVLDTFGKRVLIQRCQEHKIRNVTDHLPEDMKRAVRKAMQDAYRSRDHKRAKKQLENLQRSLQGTHPGAAGSLAEGLEETLTIVGHELPHWLERTLATTNAIENLLSSARRVSRNVKRWRGGEMVLRWMAAGVLEAEKTFRRIRGYRGMPRLLAVLREHDARLDGAVASREEVA